MIAQLFLSQDIEVLLDRLIQELDEKRGDPFTKKRIFVSNSSVANWLLLEIAKKKGIAMGIEIETLSMAPNPVEMFCEIYQSLEKSDACISYFENKIRRKIELTKQLSSLFYQYIENGYLEVEGWQGEIFQKIRLEKPFLENEEIICFGIDTLSPLYWDLLFRAQGLSIYLFSPCSDFWEDLCTDWEKKNLRKKKQTLYLKEGPRVLANWGKIGKKTLQMLDRYDLMSEELYFPIEPKTLLKQIQSDLLNCQKTQDLKTDDSIRVMRCGSSRLNEIEALKEEILSLDIPFHEMGVLMPDVEPYVSLIEYVFKDQIPYRISGFDVASQSSFRQGLTRLLSIKRWDQEEILTLFETPSFYRKMDWDFEKLQTFRNWIEVSKIKWGQNLEQRQQILGSTIGKKSDEDIGSWEKGLGKLLENLIYFRKPLQIDAELFEEFLSAIELLKNLPLQGEKSLFEWADCLEKIAELLVVDSEAVQSAFRKMLHEMREFSDSTLFPIEVIQHLICRPCLGQIHGSHLHAVHFSPISNSSLLSAKALFVLGMNEETFPKIPLHSSLNLSENSKIDLDRYQFLQLLFSAKERLYFSYCHLSSEEGKPVGASILLQELLDITGDDIVKTYLPPSLPTHKKELSWPCFQRQDLPSETVTLDFSDLKLLVKHPWQFYLQKSLQIYLDTGLEDSFALQKGLLKRKFFENEEVELEPTAIAKTIRMQAKEEAQLWQEQLAIWQIKSFSLILKESCEAPYWEEGDYIVPALRVFLDSCEVKIVGKIRNVCEKGIIFLGKDEIEKTIQIWPDVLIHAQIFGSSQIFMVQSGEIKKVENSQEALKNFLRYYFHALSAPSPLIPGWTGAVLRSESKRDIFEDPIKRWVFSRAEVRDENWALFLKEVLSELIALYPTRKRRVDETV